MTYAAELPVAPLCGGQRFAADLARAAGWYGEISGGRVSLRFRWLPELAAPRPLGHYAPAGGKGPPPRNSQSLVADLVGALAPTAREAIFHEGGKLLLVTPDSLLPHCWHLPRGGVPAGHGRALRYAVLPLGSRLGTVAHELGHLLFDWPDQSWPPGWESECLMARGAVRELAERPSPPSAPLRVEAGFEEPVPLTRELTPADLGPHRIARLDWGTQQILVEHRADRGSPRLLVYAGCTGPTRPPPPPAARLLLSPEDLERSLLGLIAVELRRLGAP